MTQVMADERELCFFRFDIPDLANAFNRFSVVNVASNTVNRIGRVDDNSTFAKTINYFPNGFRVRILFVDADKHGLFIRLEIGKEFR